jgi:hypothetical protein
MRLAVTPVLIALGVILLWHIIIADQTAYEACMDQNGSAAFATAIYWNSLSNALETPWAVIQTAILACAFLPFIIAAIFIRDQLRLKLQWVGITAVFFIIFFLLPWSARLEPGWCFGTETFDRPHLFLAAFVLVCFSLPVFITVTLFGLAKPDETPP